MDDLGHRMCRTQAHSASAYLSERRWTARAEQEHLGAGRRIVRSISNNSSVARRRLLWIGWRGGLVLRVQRRHERLKRGLIAHSLICRYELARSSCSWV